MTFKDYYGQPFTQDLNIVRSWAAQSRVSHRENLEGVFAIQPNLVKEHAMELASWGPDRLGPFSVALFFTVLLDQVCYTHFRHVYSRFEELTRYPKLRGDCPGGCQNLDPGNVFSLLGQCLPNKDKARACSTILAEALPVMKQETLNFFTQHIVAIDAEAFWSSVTLHIPERTWWFTGM